MDADTTTMISIHALWDRLHVAQKQANPDAALCLRHAIEAHNRCDYQSVLFWHQQAELCESIAA